jgi:hypothetical protein
MQGTRYDPKPLLAGCRDITDKKAKAVLRAAEASEDRGW